MAEQFNQKKIESLFDDSIELRFGCVCFDLQKSENDKLVPWPGSGWASIEGGKAFRIKSVADLNGDVKWWTNLNRDIFYKSNSFKQNKLKKSDYFKTDLGDVMKELHMVPQSISIATICEYLSDMFNRIMRLAVEMYGVNGFQEEDFTSELKKTFIGTDESQSNHLDEALMRAYQDLVICESSDINLSEYKRVVLKRPRSLHARQVLQTKVPKQSSTWDVVFKDDLPLSAQERVEYFLDLDRPFICKVKILSYNDMENAFVNLPKLLNMGDALGPKRVKKERNWMCQTELLYYSKFATLDIEAAMLAQEYDDENFEDKICTLGPMSDLSYSIGLLNECVWHAFADRSVDRHTKSKTLVTPRACWIKSADRFLTLTSAMMLSSQGHKILSYGAGLVVVQIHNSQIQNLIEHASIAGLEVPIWLVEKHLLSKQMAI